MQSKAKGMLCFSSSSSSKENTLPKLNKQEEENKSARQDFLGVSIVRIWVGAAVRLLVEVERGV